MTRQTTLRGIACIAVLAAIAFVWQYHPFSAPSVDALLNKEYARAGKYPRGGWGASLEPATHLARADKYWRKLETTMRSTGASDEEVRGVLKTARQHFSYRGQYTDFIYGVPAATERTWIRRERVWVIWFGWGVGYTDQKRGFTESPDHHRVLVIQARPPYKQLGMRTCG